MIHTHAHKAFLDIATLNVYRSKFCLLSKQKVIAQQKELFESINGKAFLPLKS